jgi:hypothetical protein
VFVVGLALSLTALAAAVAPSSVAAATTFVVNKTGDAADLNLTNAKCDTSTTSGNQCTLRAAIQEANDTPGNDTINFNITSSGTTKVITPGSPLPPITEQVKIDGYSQPGASANTKAVGDDAVLKVVLDGVNAGADAVGLEVGGSLSVIKGLVIQRFDGRGILLIGTRATVGGNFIGTTAAGTAARGNGVGIEVTGPMNTIGGGVPSLRNVISGNATDGVLVSGPDGGGNVIYRNYVGTRKGGTIALPNGGNGIHVVDSTNVQVGLNSPDAGNLISGNSGNGVVVFKESGASNAVIQGNLIGTDATGTLDLGNAHAGVLTDALNVQIGGTAAAQRNVIAGNGDAGIELHGSDENVIKGNLIGTKADGTGDLGNEDGIYLTEAADDNTIGGTGAGDANVISGNDFDGILLMSGIANAMVGNVIRLNGFHGILAGDGIVTVAGNVIFKNGEDGIEVAASATGVHITGNQIFVNDALGIDLHGGTESAAKVTSNDVDDPDGGANGLQNYPVLTSAIRPGNGITTVSGSLNSIPSTAFTIELFIAAADASGNGEGQIFAATQNVTTNSSGDKSFAFQVANLSAGTKLTATASTTPLYGNTSEFSANVTVVQLP